MEPELIWQPSEDVVAAAQITRYTDWLKRERNLSFADYAALWQWSVDDLEGFWQSIWDYFGVRFESPPEKVLGSRAMPGAEWFPGARVNYVAEVFRHSTSARAAIVAHSESGPSLTMSWSELEREVASLAAALRGFGVGPGDRVVAFLPNIAQTVVAFLASASIGAVWSVCSPDMGPVAVLDRFRQIAPKVLIACDGYRAGGKDYDRTAVVQTLLQELTSVEHMVLVPWLNPHADPERFRNTSVWTELTSDAIALSSEMGCRSITRSGWCTRRAPPGLPQAHRAWPWWRHHGGPEGAPFCTTTSVRWIASSGIRAPAGSCGTARYLACCRVPPSVFMTATLAFLITAGIVAVRGRQPDHFLWRRARHFLRHA